VIRVVRMFVERWDRDALIGQEQIIGREKASSAALTSANEREAPDYAADPKGAGVWVGAFHRPHHRPSDGPPTPFHGVG
jgi:deferrochelatase/peroxidase EfeB